jgi:type IV pilus secretin PilQ/predicted competence protein
MRTIRAHLLMTIFLLLVTAPALSVSEIEDELITISAKDMDIQELFELLNRQYDLNIVVHENVTGKVNVHLKEVTLDKALEHILWERGYSYARNGDIIKVFVSGKGGVGSAAGADGAEGSAIVPHYFRLSFLDAESAALMIEPLLTQGVGTVKGIKEGNLLFVQDLAEQGKLIGDVVKKLDAESLQVRISVKIVLINNTDAESTGFDWVSRFRASGAARPITFPFNKGKQGGIFWPESSTEDTGTGAEFSRSGGFPYSGADDFVFGFLDATQLTLLMEFIRSETDSEIVSQPEITTLHNKLAKILNGNIIKIPVYTQNIERGTSTFQGYETIETGTNLEVTPRIIDRNSVLLSVKPEVSEIVEYRGQFDEAPNVATRNVETNVIIEDGKTLILGGLTRSSKRTKETGVPFLKDIPLLGYLFRYSSEETVKDEMIIFITPRIIDREVLRKEAEGLIRHEDKWVSRYSFEQAMRLEAALFGPSPERRLRGISALERTGDEEILSILDAEKILLRVIENDTEERVRTAAVRLLANRYPREYYRWLDTIVLECPSPFDASFLVDYYLSEPARHLRDVTLMAAVLLDYPGTRDRLLEGLRKGTTTVRIRASEAFYRYPTPEVEAALVDSFQGSDDTASGLFALYALSRCGGERAVVMLSTATFGGKENLFSESARAALGLFARRDVDARSAWLLRESDFHTFLSRLREAEPPAVEGSDVFQAKIVSLLDLLEEKAPRSYDFLCLSVDTIREGDAWSMNKDGGCTLTAMRSEVIGWPLCRTAGEAVYFASLFYQREHFFSAIPEIIEGSRDQFWTVYSLAGLPLSPDTRLRRLLEGLLLGGVEDPLRSGEEEALSFCGKSRSALVEEKR